MDREGHPKEKNGYVRVFNELLEALISADIPKRAWKLIATQIRFSFGCGPQYFTSLTLKEFSHLSRLDKGDTHRALRWLVNTHIFEPDPDNPHRFKLNKFYHQWRIKVGLRDDPEYEKEIKATLKKHLEEPLDKTVGETPTNLSTNVGETPTAIPRRSRIHLLIRTPKKR